MTSSKTTLIAAIAAALVCAFAFGWVATEMPSAAAVRAEADRWQPPSLIPAAVEESLKMINERHPWGAPAPAAPAAAQAPGAAAAPAATWRLAGTVIEGAQSRVVMLYSAQPGGPVEIRYVALGEKLPDGRSVINVTGDTITLRHDDGLTTIKLYQPR